MGYSLHAVIARETVLRELADPVGVGHVVPLGQNLSLLPMTDELFDEVTVAGASTLEGFWKAPADFGGMLAAGSAHGPVAYVEAEFFGGTGAQCAQAWDGGKVVLGPLCLSEGQTLSVATSPISLALRQLGATRSSHGDEFDAVGLGRHRDTEDWIRPPG